jgi:MFS family permease
MFAFARKVFDEPLSIIRGFEPNAKGCLMVEPMWGIPYNLYAPYVGLYMLALGCSDMQIGLIAAVSLIFQMFFALVSGYITDRIGRRRTSIIFDLLGWSIPTIIWAAAWGFEAFLIAGMVNSIFRVTHTSWNCLLIEDTPPKQRVHVYTYVYIAGILAGFFAPLAGLMVRSWTLVPAMRVLYLVAFVSMTAMFIIRNSVTHETRIGKIKIEEAKLVPFRSVFEDYGRILRIIIRSPTIIIAFLMVLAANIQMVLKTNFLAIMLSRSLGFPDASIALFPAVQSLVMLGVFLFVIPRIGGKDPVRPLVYGNTLVVAGYLLLVLIPGTNYVLVILSTIITALGTAVVSPMVDSFMANAVNDEDRAKLTSILYVFLFGLSAPFSYLGGALTSVSPRLTFLLVSSTAALGAILSLSLRKVRKHNPHPAD